jgi:hypothetical protein
MLWMRKTATAATLNVDRVRKVLLIATVGATLSGSAACWAKCSDRTIVATGNIIAKDVNSLTAVMSVTASSPGAVREGVRQSVAIRDHQFRVEGYFNPTAGGIDNVCTRRPAVVTVVLRRGDQQLDARSLRIADDFVENRRNQIYTMKRELTLRADAVDSKGNSH